MSDKTDKFFHSHGIDMDKPISEINSARTLAESRKRVDKLLEEKGKIAVADIDTDGKGPKNYDKQVLFRNVRYLLKQKENDGVRLGQIERDADLKPGYMSRLEKPDNNTEPSMNFIITAARALNVSMDLLVEVDMEAITPSEKYALDFIDKLKNDTLGGKLDWNVEYQGELNRLEEDNNDEVWHPLFSYLTFYRQSEVEYPDQVTEVVFPSHSFDTNTYIHDDCYNIRLKNGARLYVMNISKAVYNTREGDEALAIELWMSMPPATQYEVYGDARYICSSKDEGPVGESVKELYSVIKQFMKHPKYKADVANIIDAFMADDFTDDDDDPIPF